MADIKTRDAVKGTIKTIDKVAIASEHMKSAYVKTKEKAEQVCYNDENSVTEYAIDQISVASQHISYQLKRQGQNAVKTTKGNVAKAKYKISDFNQTQTAKALNQTEQNGIEAIKSIVTNMQKSVKTANETSKVAIKTSTHAVKTTSEAAKTYTKAAQRAAQTAQATAKNVKKAATAVASAIKTAVTSINALITAILAGGWIAVVAIIIICLIGLLLNSVFGVFFAGEDSGNGMTMRTAVREINIEYYTKMEEIKNSVDYDVLDISGSRAIWKEIILVYSVMTYANPNNPQEIATMDIFGDCSAFRFLLSMRGFQRIQDNFYLLQNTYRS